MSLRPGFAAVLAGLLAFPALAQAAAGTVLFALGRVEIQRAGQTLAAQRGAAVEVGDTVSTGPTGLAQLRMKDGALLSLKAGSSLVVEDFHLPASRVPVAGTPAPTAVAATAAASAEGGRSVLRLLRGAFRTVTGLVGKGAADSYRVVTPAATIGIRGTDYSAAYCSGNCGDTPDGLYVGVSNGEVFVSNDRGELVLTDNQYGYVKDLSTPPSQEMAPPEVLETPIEGEDGEGDESDEGEPSADGGAASDPASVDDGGETVEARTSESGAGTSTGGTQPEGTYELLPARPGSVAFGTGPFQNTSKFAGATNNGAYTAEDGGLVGFLSRDTSGVVFYSIGTAKNVNQGYDADTGLRWGRWSGGAARVGGGALDLTGQSLHWIYALSSSAVALPTSGTVSYTLVGNTDPTDAAGNAGLLGSASFSACFSCANGLGGIGTVSSALDIAINNTVWQASGSGDIVPGSALFAGSYGVGINDALGAPIGTGTGLFAGFFTDGARGAGLSYSLTDGTSIVSGAAAFGQSPSVLAGGP